MENKSIQELFDKYEDLSIEVEQAKNAVDEAKVPDLSSEESISAEQADEHIIGCVELERKEKYLETISNEWSVIQDELINLLCKINTKVRVIDRRDGDALKISCSGGNILIEED